MAKTKKILKSVLACEPVAVWGARVLLEPGIDASKLIGTTLRVEPRSKNAEPYDLRVLSMATCSQRGKLSKAEVAVFGEQIELAEDDEASRFEKLRSMFPNRSDKYIRQKMAEFESDD